MSTRRERLADLGAARWRAVAALLLPLAAHAATWRATRTCCRSASISRRRCDSNGVRCRRAGRRDLPTSACTAAARRASRRPRREAIARGRQRAEHRVGRGCARATRPASSARAATTARAPSAAKGRGPRARARSPTCARRSSGARRDGIKMHRARLGLGCYGAFPEAALGRRGCRRRTAGGP